jgi:hypothetical protein
MRKIITCVLLLAAALAPAIAFGQATLVTPWINVQFTDETGVALAGGFVYSCASLGACPGSPQATFTDSSGSTTNANPIRLDSSGRASIWLTQGLSYTFVVTDSTGAVIPGAGGKNIMGALTSAPASLAPCSVGGAPAGAAELQYYGTSTSLACSPNLSFNPTTQVLGVSGTLGQASIVSYQGYFQSYQGYLSSGAGGGIWNAFNSATDGAYLRGYSVAQTTANTAGGYLDIAPISYNPYNGAQCIDQYGNVVQQPLPLNGLTGFGPNDALLWVGTSPSMPAGGSCGVPLPVSPAQTYQGVANQSFGLFTNSYFFARGGVATDDGHFNSFQALQGGMYAKLGMTTDQAMYLKGYAASTSLNNPAAGYGALGYQAGDIFYYFNDVSATWKTVNFSTSGGGGSAQGPANAIQANDPAGMGAFTGYTWLLAIPGSQALSALGGFTTTSGGGACALYNCIQAPIGGLYAGLGVTADQAFYPKAFATTSGLNPPASGYGGLTYAGASVGSGATYRYYNAMTPGWATVDFSTSGSGCTLGGTATGQIISNQSGACASYPNLTWNPSTNQLGIGGGTSTTQSIVIAIGYGLANGGWNTGTCGTGATAGSASTCFQSATGGATVGLGYTAGQGFYSFNFTPVGGAAPPSLNNPASGYGGLAYAGTGLYWAWNGSAWYSWTPGAGGGGGSCPGGSANQVQFNNGASACAGSPNLTFNSGTNVLNLGGSLTVLGSGSINTSNQFVGAAVNVAGVVQSQNTGTNFTFLNSNANFSVNGNGQIQVQGSATAGLNVVNTALNSIQTTGNINACSASACSGGNAIAVAGVGVINSSRQFVGSGGVSTSGSIVTSSLVNSTVSGASLAFQAGGGNFQVFGNGTVSAAGVGTFTGGIDVPNTGLNVIQTTGNINACTGACSGGNAYAVNGTVVINNLRTFFPTGIIDSGGATFGGVVTASVGIISENNIGSLGYNIVNSSGAFLNAGVSCSGTPSSSFASVNGIVTHC